MKKSIIILLIIFTYFVKANPSFDSISLKVDPVDMLTMKSAVVGQEALNLSQAQLASPAWLDRFVNWVTTPFRDVWGMYEESGYRQHGPYTVFQHHKGYLPQQVDTIRKKILAKDSVYFKLYAEIYKMATTGQTNNCTTVDHHCLNANPAKCKAFCVAIIFYSSSNLNNSYTFTPKPSAISNR